MGRDARAAASAFLNFQLFQPATDLVKEQPPLYHASDGFKGSGELKIHNSTLSIAYESFLFAKI
jgi:hypothetical protein